jgi:superfamily II DNA or RNA helicase
MTLTLRPYQTQLIDDIRAKWAGGAQNVLAVMPTGAGKTVAFSKLNSDGERSCTIVHRQELVGQISKTYALTGIYHNIIAPQAVINFCIQLHIAATGRNFYDPRAAVSVAGVDTLIRRFKPGDAWTNGIRRWTLDEAHHGRQDNKWGTAAALFPNAKGLGVTATACRGDNKSLHADQGGLFHALVQGQGMRELIDAGSLCDYRVFAPESGINEALLQIGKTGDFTANSAKAAQKAELIGDVVESYLTHISGKQAIVFASGVQDAKDIAEQFIARGVSAVALDGTNNDGHRMEQVARFETGETKILTNVDLFGEGFDVPACEAVIMARPTASFGLFVQQFGRALRPFAGKEFGIIIDHVGNVVRMAAKHGLPDTPRTWTLWQDETRKANGNPDAVPVRVCPECLLTYEAVVFACPHCGAAHVPAGRSSPDQVDGVLSEMSLELLATLRAGAAKIQSAEPAIPYGASEIVAAGIRARHRRNQAAQASLSDAMQRWGGMRLAAGDSDEVMQSRFLYRFGTDVMSAQGLSERAALELRDTIMEATRA